jgi:hypothetical protein
VSRLRATSCLLVFYGVPGVIGISCLIYVLCYYAPKVI